MAWLKGEVYFPDMEEFPRKLQDRIRKALNEQECMGWNNAIKGYLSVEWSRLADLSPYGNTCDEQEGKGLQVLTTILQHLQQTTQRLWKAWNHVLHTSTEEHLRSIRDAQTLEIRAMHANPESVQAGDRHYCKRSLEAVNIEEEYCNAAPQMGNPQLVINEHALIRESLRRVRDNS